MSALTSRPWLWVIGLAVLASCRPRASEVADAGAALALAPAEERIAVPEYVRSEAQPPPRQVEPAAADAGVVGVGSSREELEAVAGRQCLVQLSFTPPGPKGRPKVSEVVQARNAECAQKLGSQRFLLVGGKVTQLLPGLAKPPPAVEPSPGRG